VSALLSLKVWLIFLGHLLKTISPVVCVLLVLSIMERKSFKKGAALDLLIVSISITFLIRLLYFMTGTSLYSKRYLCSFTMMLFVFAAPGFFRVIRIISTQIMVPAKKVVTAIVAVACSATLISAALYRNSAAHHMLAGEQIKQMCGDQPRVLITDTERLRFTYFADAGTISTPGDVEALLPLCAEQSSNGRVFVYMQKPDEQFSATLAESSKNKFTYINTYSRKDRHYSLYEYCP